METKVILICGTGRSGSTLLDRILGQCDGIFSVGELMYIWQRGIHENQLCGCGTPFRRCEFWRAVINEAFGGFDNSLLREALTLQKSVARIRNIIMNPYQRLRKSYREDFIRYADLLGELYSAIRNVCGCSVIIDSSKEPSHLFFLRELNDIDLKVVHLVRDSRAVAYSWQRKVKNPAVHWREEYIGLGTFLKSSLDWDLHHTLIPLLSRPELPYILLRYEDMSTNLLDTLSEILNAFGINCPQLDELFDATDMSMNFNKLNHTVSGNPMRFQYGKTVITPDLEWKLQMNRYKKFAITTLTWPFLRRYGYL